MRKIQKKSWEASQCLGRSSPIGWGFLKNEAIHCCKYKSNCQIEPMKVTLPNYCEATRNHCRARGFICDRKSCSFT